VATQRVPAWVILVAVLATVVVCVGIFVGWRLTRAVPHAMRARDGQPIAPPPTPMPPKPPMAPPMAPSMQPSMQPLPGAPGAASPANVQLLTVKELNGRGEAVGNPPATVMRVVNRMQPFMLHCLQESASTGQLSAMLRLGVRFDVAATGRPENISLVDLDASPLAVCVTDGMVHHLFPSARGASLLITWGITW
jgi:hypothetical protein